MTRKFTRKITKRQWRTNMDMRKFSGAAFITKADVRNGPLLMQIAGVR